MSTSLGFTCPKGGQWYACGAGTSKFVGCCTSDPCSKGCVQGNIRPGGFNVTAYGSFPDASCGLASTFFTCSAGQSFWGCCKSDPCGNTPAATCKEGDLVPAFMERPEQFNVYAPSSLPSPSATPKSGSGNGAVIGGAVGGGVVAIIIGVLIFFFCRRRKRNQRSISPEAGASASTPMMKERPEERASAQYGGQSPPPTYSSPNPNFYQPLDPTKGHPYQPYHEYNHSETAPQELPAETSSPNKHRFSELPAESSSSQTQRLSELPASATRVAAELESPQPSPRPLQSEFSTDLAKRANQGTESTSNQVPVESR